jgi:hypothetical protein
MRPKEWSLDEIGRGGRGERDRKERGRIGGYDDDERG